jgi:hypothetical protein
MRSSSVDENAYTVGSVKAKKRNKPVRGFYGIILLLSFALVGGVFSAPPTEEEYRRLQLENRELRDKLVKLENELADYRLWLGKMTVDHRSSAGADDKRLLLVMKELSKRGNNLSLAALMIGDECKKLLQELPVGPARKAQVELRLDELDKAAGAFAGLTVPSDASVSNCRVLAVNHELKVAVISAGGLSGVFPGMVFRAKNNPSLRVMVIGVRLEGAVVEPVSGDWRELVPGTELSALYRQDTE